MVSDSLRVRGLGTGGVGSMSAACAVRSIGGGGAARHPIGLGDDPALTAPILARRPGEVGEARCHLAALPARHRRPGSTRSSDGSPN